MASQHASERPASVGKRPNDPLSESARGVCGRGGRKQPKQPGDGDAWGVCSRSAWPYRRIAEIAASQFGLITRCQLFDLGLSRAHVDKSLRLGRVVAVHRGVYAIAYRPLTRLAPYMAAVLAAGEGALLSHHSASGVWGLRPHQEGDVHVTVPGRDACRRRDGIVVHRTPALDRSEVTSRQGIPITTAARALLDVAPDLTDRQLERAFDRALTQHVTTRAAVAAVAGRSPRRAGASRLAALARAELAPETNSPAEETLLGLIRAGGLPMPQLNVWIGPYEIDMFWPDHQLSVEVDGFGFHATHRRFEHDHARDLALESMGLVVVRFTRDQVIEQPEMVLVTLAQRLAERAA